MSESGTESVLARWREAERSLAAVDPRSDEAARLADEVDRLRAEFRRVTGETGHPGAAEKELEPTTA